ncbi:MnhB domain-containing protein [Pseudonocardia nigra]|uniref:MnhB domain-containing protein n=1 Tax=Pseudonocardia nigra TaxID=1921578 RepID=UPI001C5DB1B6|nr:MnhB domain-containing protein [Pseudonocardia nigra]
MTATGTERDDGTPFEEWDRPRQPWQLSGACRGARERRVLLEMTTRALFPTVLVFSLYLLLVGHYAPGGGFSAGLVAGLAFVLRFIAGGSTDVSTAVRVRPPVVLGTGLTIALVTALAPLVVGAPVLSTAKLAAHLPLLGEVELQTSVFLDVGVYLLIIGAVLDLLRSLGAGIERDMRDAGERR